jgi:iron(III) transport system substrate-binding protein
MYHATLTWRRPTRFNIALVGICVVLGLSGCGERIPPEVTVYTSVDQEIAAPIFAEFMKSTGILVRAKYGSDLTTTGTGGTETLTRALLAERDRVRCDLFWNDEILHTLELERAGVLRPYTSPTESAFPAAARSPHSTWYAIASQARVLIVNTNQVKEARLPKSQQDLTDPQWYERVGVAKPLTGLSATHAACLFQASGDAQAQELFTGIKRNARILQNDREVATAVATGSLAFGLTNSSAAMIERATDEPVTILYPDQMDGGTGTLFIPMTVALVKDSPQPEPAEQMLEFLLSAEVARRLADGPSAFIPLRNDLAASDRVKTPAEVRAMAADFPAAGEHWNATAEILGELFAAP